MFLDGEYITAVFAGHDATETSIFLADVSADELLSGEVGVGNVVHIDLLWLPKAGSTPMDSSATNASIRYIVIAGGEIGVYGGAGFAVPHGKTGAAILRISLEDASLTLLESTDGFIDHLSPARLSGKFTAGLDELRTRQLQFAISQLVTNALGRTRVVSLPRERNAF